MNIEVVNARKYYGHRYAIGVVVLVDGHLQIHLAGKGCRKEARQFVDKAKRSHARISTSTTLTI